MQPILPIQLRSPAVDYFLNGEDLRAEAPGGCKHSLQTGEHPENQSIPSCAGSAAWSHFLLGSEPNTHSPNPIPTEPKSTFPARANFPATWVWRSPGKKIGWCGATFPLRTPCPRNSKSSKRQAGSQNGDSLSAVLECVQQVACTRFYQTRDGREQYLWSRLGP